MSRVSLQRHLRRSLPAPLLLALAIVSCWKVDADLVVSTTQLDFATDREVRTFTVTNDSEDNSLTAGVTNLEYRVTVNKPWVQVTPASGTCGELEKVTHTVTVDRSKMEYGVNSATMSISSNGGSALIAIRAVRPVPGCSDAPTAPANPYPLTGATGVPTDVTLTFEDGASQCDPLTATYDIYFGTTTPPPFHHDNDSLKVWTPPTLAENTLYYWRVVAKDANGSTSAREWTFRTVCTLAPEAVTLSSPVSNATGVSIDADLAWTGGNSRCGITRTYDVYFGKTSPPPFVGNTTIKGWDPGTMSKGTTYHWRVVAKDSNGSVSSAEQSFVTEQAVCTTKASAVTLLAPANNATNVPVTTDLTWSGGDSQCEGLIATYDVYFGTTTPPPFHHNNGTGKVWDALLDYNTVYYWRIVAKDANGSVSSNERTFRTPCNLPPTTPTLLSPADGATAVAITDNLSWNNGNSQCPGETATYDIYFGTSSPPPLAANSGTTKAWDPGIMLPGTKYYWRVVAKDSFGETSSLERDFTTALLVCNDPPGAVTLQSPADGATGVALSADLTWTGGNSQCVGQTATYDVYFGTSTPPPFDHNNGSTKAWDPGELAGSTKYYWRIVAKDGNGSTSSVEYDFTTTAAPCVAAPSAPSLSSPANGATGVSTDANLSWTGGNSQCAGLTATYDVYFGTTTPPPFDHNNGTSKTWDPGTLAASTTYYWRVVAKDANGSTSSATYDFTTAAAPCVAAPSAPTLTSPTDGATGVSTDANLTWTGGNSQCAGLTATYDVYFGTTTPPPFHHNNGSAKTWDPGTLTAATTYYWRIVAKDANGSTSSATYDFVTAEPPCLAAPAAPTLSSPADGATDVSTSANLTWTGGNSQCAGLTATYDVYFGTTTPPPFDHNNGSTKTWDPGTLLSSTTYYWRVVAKDANGSTSSATYDFTTAAPPCVAAPTAPALSSPADGATDVATDANLSWTGGNSQCAGLTATYDVYFGTTTPPPFDHNNGSTRTWDPGTLTASTTYYWRIVAKDANGSTSSATYDFTTAAPPCVAAPTAPAIVSPANGATDVATDANLTWTGGNSQCAGLTATYDVYFGTTNPPPFHHNNGSTKTWDPGTLADGTTYYWRIVAKDDNGATVGPVWSFTTLVPCVLAPTAPTVTEPANNATDIPVNDDLFWAGGNSQCAGLTATYDVYFGTSNPPSFDHDNGSSKTWDPGTLQSSTTYYWQIVAKDANGETAGPVWSFTTEPPCLSPPTVACSPVPNDNRTNVNENTNLSWGCGDSQCGLAVTYDVYFGTTPTLGEPQKLGSTTTKAWDLPKQAKNTQYYWKVVTKDANGTVEGPVWTFTTRQ